MAFFTLACAFHKTEQLLAKTLPLAIKSLTQPTRHDFEVVLVADRSADDVAARLHRQLPELGVDELRFRRSRRNSYGGSPSNNFHANHFSVTSQYLVTFTDDTFIWKTDDQFDVLDAMARIFRRHPEVVLISKVDDHHEWDGALSDAGPPIEPGVRSVNRVVDQLIAYDTRRFAPVADSLGAWDRDTYTSEDGFEYQWENLASSVGTTGGRKIAFPDRWPLRVCHSDLRLEPGSMHGTQDEDIKLACFERLMETSGASKR